MSKTLDNKMNMYATVDGYLNKNAELLERFGRLKTEYTNFSTMRATLVLQIAGKTQVTTGITAQKETSFSVLGNLMMRYSLKALVWTKDTNNQALAAVFTIVPSRFAIQTYAKKLDQAKAVYTAIKSNAVELAAYNISDSDLLGFAAALTDCESIIIAPGKASKDKQTAGSVAKTIELKMDESLVIIDNLITSDYTETEPKFVSGYLFSRKIDTVGVRHTGLRVTVTAAATGKAIESATLIIIGTNKTAISNMAGLVEIIKMKAGSYHISISAEGYNTQLQDVTVPRSKVMELAVDMVLV